jgi:serine/threonine protein kinase
MATADSFDDDNIPVLSAGTYAKGTVLGTGSFGIVYESVDVETGEPVAIKAVYQDKRYKVSLCCPLTHKIEPRASDHEGTRPSECGHSETLLLSS